jgi:DNA-binding transcriptional ArsR family regulator
MSHFDEMNRHATAAAGLLKALAHPERLMVLCQLVEGEKGRGAAGPQPARAVGLLPATVGIEAPGPYPLAQSLPADLLLLVSEAAADVLAALQTHFCHSDEEIR